MSPYQANRNCLKEGRQTCFCNETVFFTAHLKFVHGWKLLNETHSKRHSGASWKQKQCFFCFACVGFFVTIKVPQLSVATPAPSLISIALAEASLPSVPLFIWVLKSGRRLFSVTVVNSWNSSLFKGSRLTARIPKLTKNAGKEGERDGQCKHAAAVCELLLLKTNVRGATGGKKPSKLKRKPFYLIFSHWRGITDYT